MVSKNQRFTRTEFTAFAANPSLKTTYNRLGTLKYTASGHKFAVVANSKHEKRAVVRNKIRRRVYNHIRAVTGPFSGILYLSKQSYTLSSQETATLFAALLFHAGSK